MLIRVLGAPDSAFAAALTSDLNHNGILDHNESDVVVDASASLPAGEYTFHNLIITNGATLTTNGDPTASGFKGTQITAESLTISAGTAIAADGKGYASDGPGSAILGGGGSYGGAGEGRSLDTVY